MREEPSIPRVLLQPCVRDEHGLTPASIEFLLVGRGMNAGVYRVSSLDGTSCLLKVKSGEFYAASCMVPRYLYDQGITSVVAPLPTRTNQLCARAGEWTVVLYPYIEGEMGWATMSDEHWKAAGCIVERMHEVPLPTAGFEGVRKETFDPSEYARSLASQVACPRREQ